MFEHIKNFLHFSGMFEHMNILFPNDGLLCY